jgi:predicted ferric reductase
MRQLSGSIRPMRRYFFYLFLLLNLGVILTFWWQGSGSFFALGHATVLIALGRLAGLLAAFFVLLQFSLIGRNVWVERTFGFDRLAHFHRYTGFCAIFFVILHPLLIIRGYSLLNGVGFIAQELDFITNYEDVLESTVAALLFTGVVFMSLYIVRKRLRYEAWYITHLTVYVAIALAWGHQLANGGDFLENPLFRAYWYGIYALVFLSLLIFRFLRPAWLYSRHSFKVSRIVRETADAVSVYVKGERLEELNIKPGQFLTYRPLTKKWILQNHPFSVSMLPKNGELRFTAKRVGDFTAELPAMPAGTPLYIDGPFGVFRPERPENRKFLFIGGGIGITPIRTILESLPDSADSVLLYANRKEDDIVFREELDALAQTKKISIHHVLSDSPLFAGEKGRIDLDRIRRLAPDFAEREIFLCGPPLMIKSLRAELISAGIPREKIRFERFSMH